LRERGADPRIQKAVAILAEARAEHLNPAAVCSAAAKELQLKPGVAELTKAALLRNLDIARKLGCLDAGGLDDMRHGKAATIRKGPYKGDQPSVDHIIPRAVAPERGLPPFRLVNSLPREDPSSQVGGYEVPYPGD